MSIFSTTANTGFNSFSDPLNPVNMNGGGGGGWGLDSNYLTPSYMAPYRPSYGGPQGGGFAGKPGFLGSANQLLNPFAPRPPTWGSPVAFNQPYMDGLSQRPGDASVSFGQSIVAPTIAAYGAYKLSQITTSRVGGAASFSGKAASAWESAWGGSAGAVANAGARQGIFAAAGAQTGRSMAGGFFSAADFATGGKLMSSGAGVAARGAFVGGATALGGLAGGLILPMMAAQGAVELGQQMLFNPYVASRRTADDLRNNFSHVTLGGRGGDVITGKGLSRLTAARVGSDITQAGIRDRSFSEFDMSKISDLSARSGLLDDSSIGQISSKVKDISKLVKLMMNLTNDPDLKNNIETIVKLKNSGLSLSGIGGAMSSIGFASGISGISTQRMMNTVGAQGQFLAQSNGLTPYLGQIASANAMAGFSSAYRTGLISKSTMAMMGGVEGATQSATSGQISAGQTLYNRVSLYNQHMGGGRGRGVVDNLSKFGSKFATDPMAIQGEMELNEGMMRSVQLKDRGPLGIQDQVMDIAKNLHQGIGKNGKLDGRVAYMLLTKEMGMTSPEARAFLQTMDGASNPKVLAQQMAAVNGTNAEQLTQILNQQGLNYGMFNGVVNTARSAWQGTRSPTANGMSLVAKSYAWLGDSISKKYHEAVYGKSLFESGEGFSTSGGSKSGTQSDRLSSLLKTVIGDRASGPRDSNARKEILIGHAGNLAELSESDFYSKYADYSSGKLSKDDPLNASFREMTKAYGTDAKTLFGKSQTITNLAVSSGQITTAQEVAKFGSTADFMKKVLGNKKDYFTSEQSAALDKKLAGAKTSQERENITLAAFGEARGLTIKDSVPDNIEGNMSKDARDAISKQFKSMNAHKDMLLQLNREGKIDTSTTLHSIAVDKMATYIDSFGYYVENFGDKALGRNGKEQVRSK